jgi:hypothetical protein
MRLYLISLFVLFAFYAHSQQGTFLKVFAGNSYEEGIKTFRLPNKTYRIVGNTGTYGWGQKNIWLIALDSNANFMWHKTYGEGGFDFAQDAQMDSKGNIYIIGSSTSQSSNSYQMLLVGVDTNGHYFTYSYFGGMDWDFGNGIQIVDDTLLMLAGETYSYGNGQSKAWLIQTRTNGQMLWSSIVGGSNKESFSSVKQLYNGDFVCSGYSKSFGNGSKDPMLYRCNSQGDSLWMHAYNDTTDGEFYDLIINNDTNIIAVGYQKDTTDSYQDLSIMNVDINGQLKWNRNSLKHHDDANYKGIIKENDRYIVTGMSSKYGNGNNRIYGSRLERDGWWNASFIFGSSENDYSNSIVKDTSNNQLHYIITGTTRSYGLNFTAAIVIRMDSSFQADTVSSVFIPSAISSAKSSDQLSLKIFPNPASDIANIEIPNNKTNDPFELHIYNMIGELIFENRIEKGQNSLVLDTRNWPKSSYFVIVNNSTVIYKAILIKK